MKENEAVLDGLKRFYKDSSIIIEKCILRPIINDSSPHYLEGDVNMGVPAKCLENCSFELIQTKTKDKFTHRKFDGSEDVKFFIVDISGSAAIFKRGKQSFNDNDISVPYISGESLTQILCLDGRFDCKKLSFIYYENTSLRRKPAIEDMTVPFEADDKTTLQFKEKSNLNQDEVKKRQIIISEIEMNSGTAIPAESNELQAKATGSGHKKKINKMQMRSC